MGITIVVQSENGEQLKSVGDPTNVLHRVLPSLNDQHFQILNRIDWYGDTTFNRIQAKDVARELETLLQSVEASEDTALLRAILQLARHVEQEVHQYLKFIGD